MRVSRVLRLSSSFVRITFTGDDVHEFGTAGLDQRIKLVLPIGGGFGDYGLLDEGSGMMDWYSNWRLLDDAERNPIRTYTVRAVRPHLKEVDLDFVLHGDTGPASAWATTAVAGDEVVLVGPNALAAEVGGIEWHPGDASTVLLAGDETAVPAISAILESLPSHVSGHAFLEVPHVDDALQVDTASQVGQTWLGREGAAVGSRLGPAVRQWIGSNVEPASGIEPDAVDIESGILWEVPGDGHGDFYAWFAGEAGVITDLRRFLVRDTGVDRRRVAFMGYWRSGRAEN